MTYAILNGNTVENLIVADEEFCDLAYPGHYVLVTGWCDIGAIYDPTSGTFSPAPQPVD